MEKLLLLSFATASIAFTVTETRLFRPARDALKNMGWPGELLSCGYCTGHWVALTLVLICRVRLFDTWWLLDYVLTALAVAWLAGVQVILMCLAMDKAGK